MFTPEEIASRQFLIALRGYDREEVDAFVREVADEQQRLLERLQRLEERLSAADDAAAAPDHAADHTVDHREAFRRLGEETTRILVAAEEAAAGIEQRAQEDARAAVTAARESAQREIDEARSEAEQIVARAREERERTLEAVRELEASQRRLAADLDEAVRAVSSVAARLHPDVGTQLAEVAAEVVVEPQGPSEPATQPQAAPTAATAEPPEQEAVEPEQETVEPDTGIHLPGEVAPADAARSVSDVVSHSLREEALTGIRPGMVRRLKRTLQDVQNGVLATLRRAAGGGEVDTPSGDDLDALAGVGEPFLVEAYRAGLRDGAQLADVAPLEGDVDAAPARAAAEALGEELAHEIAASLEPTLRAGLDAGEDISSLSDRVGEVFRDLKGPVAEAAVDEHLTRTYGLGVHDGWAAAGVTTRVWVLGDEPRCPENRCRSNASEGPVAIDREFPSGHLVPPAHPGCTCTVAPVQG